MTLIIFSSTLHCLWFSAHCDDPASQEIGQKPSEISRGKKTKQNGFAAWAKWYAHKCLSSVHVAGSLSFKLFFWEVSYGLKKPYLWVSKGSSLVFGFCLSRLPKSLVSHQPWPATQQGASGASPPWPPRGKTQWWHGTSLPGKTTSCPR